MNNMLTLMRAALARYKFNKLSKTSKRVYIICTVMEIPFSMTIYNLYFAIRNQVYDTFNSSRFIVRETNKSEDYREKG